MKSIVAAILIITTFFSLAFGELRQDTVAMRTATNIEFKLMAKIIKDDNYFAVLRKLENDKVYLKKISKNCYENKNPYRQYTLIKESWTTEQGRKGSKLTDPNNELCPNNNLMEA